MHAPGFFYFLKSGWSVNSAIAGKKCMGNVSAGNISGKLTSNGKRKESGATNEAMVIIDIVKLNIISPYFGKKRCKSVYQVTATKQLAMLAALMLMKWIMDGKEIWKAK